MKLMHKCGNNLYFTLDSCIMLLAEADPDGSHVKTTSLVIHQTCEKLTPTKLYCPSCRVFAEPKDIVAQCYECHSWFSLDAIFFAPESGGIHCDTCFQKYLSKEDRKVLAKCVASISMK